MSLPSSSRLLRSAIASSSSSSSTLLATRRSSSIALNLTRRSPSYPKHSSNLTRPTRSLLPQRSIRAFSTSRPYLSVDKASADVAPEIAITELSTSEYEDVSDRDMEILNESLELLCEDFGGGEWEVEYSSGVLTLSLTPHGTYVINKQPPNQQIWISSPLSGPMRFSYHDGVWVHHRQKGITLGSLLDKEMREIMEKSSIKGHWEGTGLQ